ncbi:MAG: OmpH family outer membrane protein, partial [Bacteroidetes bacterium]
MNNKIIFFFFTLFSINSYIFAQKFGYVDSDFIMGKMPSYEKVQVNLQNAAKKWQEDIQKIMQKIDKLKADYLSEELLLTDELKKERQEEIKKI